MLWNLNTVICLEVVSANRLQVVLRQDSIHTIKQGYYWLQISTTKNSQHLSFNQFTFHIISICVIHDAIRYFSYATQNQAI